MTKSQKLEEDQSSFNQGQECLTLGNFTESASQSGKSMKKVHITLQGKGGIGKSFVSIMIAQYIKQQDSGLLCLDTDPINATFSTFSALHVRSIALLEGNNMINERGFDEMMEQIINSDSNVVIDNGAASYVPLSTYLMENQAFDIIQRAGKQVIVHSVIAGGLAQDNTVSDFAALTSQLPEGVGVVVWLNEYRMPNILVKNGR